MIGSQEWLRAAERGWCARDGVFPFDPVKAFRRDCLREASALRPRPWGGDAPWVLHCRYERSSLHPRFVAYLDKHVDIQDWREMFRELQHQPLEFWRERLMEAQEGDGA